MEHQTDFCQKIESGPIRRLETLSRWMETLDINPDMQRLLDDSIDDLRDAMLHLMARDEVATEHSACRPASWQGSPQSTAERSVPGEKKENRLPAQVTGIRHLPPLPVISLPQLINVRRSSDYAETPAFLRGRKRGSRNSARGPSGEIIELPQRARTPYSEHIRVFYHSEDDGVTIHAHGGVEAFVPARSRGASTSARSRLLASRNRMHDGPDEDMELQHLLENALQDALAG